MTTDFSFRCPLPQGMHARPASLLAQEAASFRSSLTIRNERTGAVADLSSVLSLVSAGILHDDPCCLEAHGDEAERAVNVLGHYILEVLPGLDTPEEPPAAGPARTLPRSLVAVLESCLQGIPVSGGIGVGTLVHAGGLSLPKQLLDAPVQPATDELARLNEALFSVGVSMRSQVEAEPSQSGRDILKALQSLLHDKQLQGLMRELVESQGKSAEQAVVQALEGYSAKLRQSGSVYLAERVVDLQDIGVRLIGLLSGEPAGAQCSFSGPSVLAAGSLGAAQFLELDRGLLKGLVLGSTGATSHAAILARSFGIPAVSGIDPAALAGPGTELIVDGRRGLVIQAPGAQVLRFYQSEAETEIARRQRDSQVARAGVTQDGAAMTIMANVSSSAEALAAFQAGADGIGLFRTEMLFTGRDDAPSEGDQYDVYRETVMAMQGRPVTFRTLDIGGDKPVAYLNLPREENPFLGVRGMRLYEQLGGLVDTQLRALLRASAFGTVKIMAPMLSTLGEARQFRERVKRIQEQLSYEGTAFDPEVKVGAMIEVPAAAMSLDQLGKALDFFSIGSNDLAQYFFAADRGNPAVSSQFSEREPSFLGLLFGILTGAERWDLQNCICGEMAGQVQNLPLLVGMGMEVLSVSTPAISPLRAALARLNRESCQQLFSKALSCESAQEVEELLRQSQPASSEPMLSQELLRLSSVASSKGEAIRELVNLCYANGRCDDADSLEEAVWSREETYSTGLGYGFAIPHCKSAAVVSASLALLRPAQPIEWGSLDGAPVATVILLAMPEAAGDNQHLKVFARLARRLMDESFRQTLQSIETEIAVLEYLNQELEMGNEKR